MSPSWRWNNIPLPEPHIIGILVSGALHLARPWGISGDKRLYRVPDGALSGLESRSRHRQCGPPPMSIWSSHTRSFPAGLTPSVATRCMSAGRYSILEVRSSCETRGWSHRFRLWEGSFTVRFFEKSTRCRERSE